MQSETSVARSVSGSDRASAFDALSTTPHLSSDAWSASSLIARWMIASRAAVLVMTFVAVATAGALALLTGLFDSERWILCAFGLLFAHAASNQLNELIA